MYPSRVHKPHLYCNDDFVIEQTWDTAVMGKDGNYLRKPSNEEFFTVGQVYRYFTDRDTHVPYFLPDLRAYFFDAPDSGHCSPNSLGETWHGMHGGHDAVSPVSVTNTLDTEIVIICPASHDPENAPTMLLGEAGWQDPDDGESLDMLVPASATVYHELFHLVSGRIGYRPDMDPRVYLSRAVEDFAFGRLSFSIYLLKNANISDLEDVLQLERDEAIRNAETYMFFSLAYWYWKHDWNNGKQKITFYPGYAVYDDWI